MRAMASAKAAAVRAAGADEAPSDGGGRRWGTAAARKLFVKEMAAELGVESLQDWKRVTRKDVEAAGGAGLLKRYNNSLFLMLKACLPEKGITVAMVRRRARKGQWGSWENRRQFMEEVAAKKHIRHAVDWATVRVKDVVALGGGGLLKHYNDSVIAAVIDLFPELCVKPVPPGATGASKVEAEEKGEQLLQRRQLEKGHWDCPERRKAFVELIKKEFHVSTPGDWKKVSARDVIERGGAGLLARYRFSLHALLVDTATSTEAKKDMAVFRCRGQTPRKYFESEENVAAYLRELKEELGIVHDEEWFRLSSEQLRKLKGRELWRRGLMSALPVAFPDTNWEQVRRRAPVAMLKKASQRVLRLRLQSIFAL